MRWWAAGGVDRGVPSSPAKRKEKNMSVKSVKPNMLESRIVIPLHSKDSM